MLFEKILDHFQDARARYAALMSKPEEIDSILAIGAEKARAIATKVLNRVTPLTGF
jgi:tryptophanyl-tRNA synthetase